MKRIVICLVVLAGVLTMKAQVPDVTSRVCAECGGNEQRKQGGQWVQISEHKSWCSSSSTNMRRGKVTTPATVFHSNNRMPLDGFSLTC